MCPQLVHYDLQPKINLVVQIFDYIILLFYVISLAPVVQVPLAELEHLLQTLNDIIEAAVIPWVPENFNVKTQRIENFRNWYNISVSDSCLVMVPDTQMKKQGKFQWHSLWESQIALFVRLRSWNLWLNRQLFLSLIITILCIDFVFLRKSIYSLLLKQLYADGVWFREK